MPAVQSYETAAVLSTARSDEQVVEQAVEHAVERYLASRERRVDGFVRRHYSFRGSLKLHAHAVGWDLVRIPLNIAWSVPRFLIYLLTMLARLVGCREPAAMLARVPSGLTTNLDRHIGRLVVTDLLELPHPDAGDDGPRDALMEEIFRDPALERLIDARLESLSRRHSDHVFRQKLALKLAEYGASRTGTSELASNLMVVLSSQLALGQAAWGSLGAGSAIAASVAKSAAISSFWLGPVAGSWFYALVPVTPSLAVLLSSMVAVAVALAVVATFIGILVDPLQARLGLHQRRLRKLLYAIRQDLGGQTEGQFQLREKYVGRVCDVLDYLTLAGRSL
ncbi:MAG: hypothetical protein HWE39_18130 [Oceanospirillaceae bacterium]|nr:hypothetical protein [Oceanospirillaceae bacterium]